MLCSWRSLLLIAPKSGVSLTSNMHYFLVFLPTMYKYKDWYTCVIVIIIFLLFAKINCKIFSSQTTSSFVKISMVIELYLN